MEYNGIKYKYLGNGPKATGSERGWKMSADLYFRCIECGYLMSGNPKLTENCTCGKLYKDADCGRVGSRLGDEAVEVFCKD